MDFTFGIITDGKNDDRLKVIIESIRKQNIPNYQILIVGNCFLESEHDVEVIFFDGSIKPAWITKKKNIVTENAKYENVVYLHDYIMLEDGWYEGWLKFGDDYFAAMNIIKNLDGTRYRDWTLFPPHAAHLGVGLNESLIGYDVDTLSKFMYFSGAYFVCKKSLMIELPLDERRSWGEGEDVEWSVRYREKYEFKMNTFSSVRLLKYKDRIFGEASEETNEKFRRK